MDTNYRDAVRAQHTDFTAALDRARHRDPAAPVGRPGAHPRWSTSRLIHAELRTIRQRAEIREASSPAGADRGGRAAPLRPPLRWLSTTPASPSASAGRKSTSRPASSSTCRTSPGCRNVLDIGCGRGEFLEMMREAGVPARGIDLERGIGRALPPQGSGGRNRRPVRLPGRSAGRRRSMASSARRWWSICRPERLPEMIRLAASRLERNGVHRHRNAQPRVPGDFRHSLLPGPDPHRARCRTRCWRSTWRSSGSGGSKCTGSRRRWSRCPRWRPCRRISARRSSAAWITRSWGRSCKRTNYQCAAESAAHPLRAGAGLLLTSVS